MVLKVRGMNDVSLQGKSVLIREDLNVPIVDGRVTNTARLEAAVPTIRQALASGAKVLLMSHLGRPQEGLRPGDPGYEEFSLAPVAKSLSDLLSMPVPLIDDYLDGFEWGDASLVLLENVRFCVGESENSQALSAKLGALCDVFVMDAFATAHRAQASTEGVIRCAPLSCAGPLLMNELQALEKVLAAPARPLLAIVGGSKVSTKLSVLENLSQKTDQLITGGGIANTFMAAAGINVGASLYEPDLLETARRIMQATHIPLPVDVVVAKSFPEKADTAVSTRTIAVSAIEEDDMILDMGPETLSAMSRHIAEAGTILWNGPVGVFEVPAFSSGTRQLTRAIANSSAFSVAGGGDTLAAIDAFGVRENLSYISTGGGAFLEFIEGKKLPAVKALEESN